MMHEEENRLSKLADRRILRMHFPGYELRRVIEERLLRDAFAEGRLSPVEHEERLTQVYAATTYADLVPLLHDRMTESVLASLDEADALAQYRAWQAAGQHLRVAVNLSVRNLYDHELAGWLSNLLADAGIVARRRNNFG